jgi:2,3-dihydroxybenzoate decarboxylase
MAVADKPFVIALEEHYYDRVVATVQAEGRVIPAGQRGGVMDRLQDVDELRLEEMDGAGIDIQVLSHAPSPIQQLPPDQAIPLATDTNNRLLETVKTRPDRFAGFGALPTSDPKAATAELERVVKELGFKGAMIHGRTQGKFHDDERFWPIFEKAQELDVPIYIHPGPPHPAVAEAYYADYLDRFPGLNSAAWGFTIDTANQALRLILSGLFDAFPRLKLILGHLGEGLPFMVDRIDESLNRGANKVRFKDLFCEHFWITTSGHFSTPALLCSILELGIDRVLFSVDYPYVESLPGMKWMETVPLSREDREKMFNGNARRLLKM